MKERLLFHLRLGDSSSPLARRKSLVAIGSSGGPPPGRGGTTTTTTTPSAETEEERPPHLVCTCLHSSESSAVAVGFERGVVHVYYRQHEDRIRRSSEEERWKRSVIYPTRALGSGVASPIESPAAAAAVPPDITCVAIAPGGGKLAVGTSDGFVFVTQAPPPPTGDSPGTGWARGSGFHHKSHRGKRINCLLWDKSGDQLYSVCEGGTVVLARNLRPRRGGPAAGVPGITGVMQFLGVHQPDDSSKADTPASPQAIVVGHTGSPGVSLDLGRTRASLPGATKGFVACDVLLVMTRKRAVLFYFAVGEDVSVVAPQKISVDLNVIDDTTTDTGRRPHGGNNSGTPPPPPPPSRTDFGACLWGPAQMPGVGGSSSSSSSSSTSTSAGASGAPGRNSGGRRRTPERRESYEVLPAAAAAPRAVLFAYVAQPGGRLWRVGLSDGEVESMHRPLGIDEGGVGLPVESGVELGEMWAVDVGEARALLCWRSGFSSKKGGEFALLDPNTHSFVAACPGMSGTVDVSGFVLSPFSKSEGGGSLQSIRQRLEVLGGGVRVLHGGDLAKVTMLYHNAEGEAWSISSSEAIEGWGAALSAEAAARTVQRAWRATREGRSMAADTAAAEGGDTPPTATRDPPLQLLMPGDFPLRGRGAAAAPPSSLPSLRDVAAGDPNPSAAARGHRYRQDRDDSDGRVPESLRSGNGGLRGGGSSSRSSRRGARSRSKNFSVRDSIEALDAADRALQLSSHSRQASSPMSGDRGEDSYWPTDDSSSRSRRTGGGGGGSSGTPSGSESDGGANAMCRATDALIRQTWPVLHRTGSLENLALPPDSPPFRSAPASFPTDARGRAARGATLPGITAGGMVNTVDHDADQEHASEQESEEAAAEAATAVTGFDGGGRRRRRWEEEEEEAAAAEEEEEEEEEAAVATTLASSPTAEPPPSAGWKIDGGVDERAERRRGRSPAGRETGSLDRQPSSLRSSIPFPRGPVGAQGVGGGGRLSRPSRGTGSGFPLQSHPARPRRKSSPPASQHGNLFGLGTLLQRSVQAVNEALQPGGGATSDEDSLPDGDDGDGDGDDTRVYADNTSGGSVGGYSSGNEDGAGADGGTTSDAGKESWSASSDRSEVGTSRGGSVATAAASGAGADGDEGGALRAEGGTSDAGGTSEGGGGRGRGPRRGDAGWKRRRKMLLVSGMMGVKRQCLGTLRSRRESRIQAHLATVTELPVSAMDDPNPFVPPSQYEVRLNVSRGLGLSLNITGNDVRVKGFSLVQGGDIGPAQACGDIQVGDALVRVNHEQLNLLNHENVVRVLRGLLHTAGSQVLLLRFAYAEDSPRLLRAVAAPPPPPPPPPPPLLPPKTPVRRPSIMGNPRSEPRVSQGGLDTEDAFRSESWHGSSKPPREMSREGHGQGREMARSVSPHRRTGPAVLRSQSGPPAVAELARIGSSAEAGGKEAEGWTVEGMRPRGKRRGELWGEPEMGLAGGDGGSRHIYLGDMGHARVQRTLQAIAEDVQGLYQVRHSSEECRFFHGRKRRSLTDPSSSSLEHRLLPPSVLLAPPPPPPPPAKTSFAPPGAATPPPFDHGAPGVGGPEAPPPLPRELYRGRRRRRPRRRRSSSSLLLARASAGGGGGGGGASGGEEAAVEEEEAGGVINLVSCQGVVQAEVGRLEGELERQEARLARRNRRSSARSLVAKILHKYGPSTPFSDDSPSPTARSSGRVLAAGASSGSRSSLAGGTAASWREGSGGGGLSDGDLIDSSDDVSGSTTRRGAAAAAVRVSGEASRVGLGRVEDGLAVDDDEEAEEEEEGACDIFLEAVSTAGLQEELLCNRDVEVLGVDPPRPLPAAAYDLQTALESVQHFATQTLAGVVQAAAVRGSGLYDYGYDYDPLSGSRSPRHLTGGGGGRAGKGSAAKEARDAAAAAGLVEGWEAAWPPRELTAALGLVTARQMAHAMRCDAEPLIQIWMRCFTPVDAKHRTKLWGGLAPPPSVNDRFLEAGRWHRQLVCGLVTLYAQVHMSWPFLARPSDDPDAVGLRSLRLETTWFGTVEDVGAGAGGGGLAEPGSAAGEEKSPIGAGSAAVGRFGDRDEAGGGGGERGPSQWDEEKAVGFIQDYGAYLEADALAAAASCREMEWALDEVLHLAEQCEDYKSKERVLHQLLRGPRTPSFTTVSGKSSPMVWHQRPAMFGTTPVRSPANSISTTGTRTPGNWTPTIMSPSRAAFPSYQLPSEAMSGGGGGGGGSGWKDGDGFGAGTFDAASSSGPMEEDAVRKALGLLVLVPPADPAGTVVGEGEGERHQHRRQANADHGQAVGLSGHEAGGSGRLSSQTTNQAPGRAPLCLLLNNLGELFRWDVAAAAEMCADAFPGVRPWNVHHALHQNQDKPWTTSTSEPVTPVEGGSARYQASPAGAGVAGSDGDGGTRSDAAFHAYLWAVLRKHPGECRGDWKVIQRCLQLSLRLSTKLRSLPSDHPLHSFCKAATRNFKRRRRADDDDPATRENGGRHPEGAFSTDGRGQFHNNRRWRAGGGSGGGSGTRTPTADLRLGVEDSGETGDGSAWRRYSDVVEQVVSQWCQDGDAFSLDPLWLLPKLRAHKNWPVAFRICAAITCSWEEQEAVHQTSTGGISDYYAAAAAEGIEQGHDYSSLVSTLPVLDTLADACFVTFDDGDTETLAAALGATWAADGALRRVSLRARPPPLRGDGGGLSPGQQAATACPSGGDRQVSGQASAHGNVAAAAAGPELGHQSPTGSQGSSSGAGACAEEDSHETSGGGGWVEESRMVDVVRGLARRCSGQPVGADEAGGSNNDGGDADGRGDADVGCSSTGGVDASMTSEDPEGGSGGGGSAGPLGALSLVELAEAVLDAVGPEATGDVLAACPHLLEGIPPKFFQDLADRQAALSQQQALEAALLHQATAAVWASRGRRRTAATGAGDTGGISDASPLGPRLAWLACEELTSFFQDNANSASASPNARLLAGEPGSAGSSCAGAGSPPGLQHYRRATTEVFAAGVGGDLSRVFGGYGGNDDGLFRSLRRKEPGSVSQGFVATLGANLDLNLVLPGNAHRGAAFDPASPCGFCGLALSGGPVACDGGGDGGEEGGGELVLCACGRGMHSRCLAAAGWDGGWDSGRWYEAGSMLVLSCPQCA